MTASSTDLADLLPGYTLVRELGRGAMGIVYLARHESLDRLVAVKELQGTLAADPATRSRFVVEAKVMASLDHPHVVPVYDFVERGDRCALVMEQLPGGTVWDRFVEHGLTMPHAVAITLATCAAMQHAHDHDVLHRDIKPENLMFDRSGSLKVTDFGIARVVNGARTKATVAGSVLGTPAYMAPEQAEGRDVGPAADVYATATMLYEMLSGRLPFERVDSLPALLTQRILHDPILLGEVAPQVPSSVASATMRGLARTASERTPSAQQLGRELAEAAAAAWGASWLDASGLTVEGADSIVTAARSDRAPGDANATVLPGSVTPVVGRANATMLPDAIGDVSADDDRAHTPEADPHVEVETSPAAATTPPARARPVKPQASDRDLGRARADEIDQLIEISEILKKPPVPVAQYLLAAALIVAGIAWAVIGGGSAATEVEPTPAAQNLAVNGVAVAGATDPIELDLTEPVLVTGVPFGSTASIEFEQFGLPIGTATPDNSAATGDTVSLDTGFIGRVTSGAVDATVLLGGGAGTTATPVAAFAADGTNPWVLSAAGVISMVLLLFSVAGVESYLRAFRRGKGGISSFGGLLVTGALAGATASTACTIAFGTARGLVAVAGPAALCACGALALGLATRANRKRRRAARQELRHTAIKALAKR